MSKSVHRLSVYLTGISAGIALIITLGLPLGYLSIVYQTQAVELATEAEMNARELTELVSEYPESWRLQRLRLESLINEDMTEPTLPEQRAMYDAAGQLIVAAGEAAPLWRISHRADFHDAGRVVGSIEVSRDLTPVAVNMALLAGLGLLLGGAVSAILRLVPIRALNRSIEALRAEKDRAQVTLGAIRDAVIAVDALGQIGYINAAAEHITGLRAADIIGRSLFDVMPVPLLLGAHGVFSGGDGSQGAGVALFVGADGRERTVECRFSPIYDPLGFTTGGVVVLGDVTERVQAERAQRELNEQLEARVAERTRELAVATRQAEDANRAKSTFLANMSHEIRTPMNSVLGMARLALRSGLTDRQRGYIENIYYSGQHLLQLIDEILDISKIEAGKLRVESIDFLLASVVANLGNLMTQRAAAKSIAFDFDIDPALAQPLHGDPLRLGQVLINLAGNAIKFTERGRVGVSASLVEEADDGLLVRFEVSDTGIGISVREIADLFQVFQQADPSTTRRFGGSGLGLAISKQLVTLMGGEIGVHSEPGAGSSFWFTVRLGRGDPAGLPALHQDDHATTRVPSYFPAVLRGARILLVEDNLFNQQVACEMLEDAGAVVCVANNGGEALEFLRGERFDGVLMDVQMPEMDGFTATRQIRADAALAGTLVIAMTANASNEDLERCLAAGMDEVVTKPVFPERLYAVLAEQLAMRAGGRESTAGCAIAPGTEAEKLIDLAVLARMVGHDPQKIHKYAVMFLAAARSGLDEMEAVYDRQDMENLAGLGHRLKSSALAVGAAGFGNLCQRLESLKRHSDAPEARRVIDQLHDLLARIGEEIDKVPPV